MTGDLTAPESFAMPKETVIYGDDQDNTLEATSSTQRLVGGKGDDIYILRETASVIELENEGNDSIYSFQSIRLSDTIENASLFGKENIDAYGTEKDNDLWGNDYHNVLEGFGGNDYLAGYAGDDILRGGSGNDDLAGGKGNDILEGGTGDDIYLVHYSFDEEIGTDTITDVGGTNDQLYLHGCSSDDFTLKKESTNLIIQKTEQPSDKITIQNYFDGNKAGNGHIETIHFDDTSFSLTTVLKILGLTQSFEQSPSYNLATEISYPSFDEETSSWTSDFTSQTATSQQNSLFDWSSSFSETKATVDPTMSYTSSFDGWNTSFTPNHGSMWQTEALIMPDKYNSWTTPNLTSSSWIETTSPAPLEQGSWTTTATITAFDSFQQNDAPLWENSFNSIEMSLTFDWTIYL